MGEVRVLIADDNKVVRQSIRSLVSERFDVVGEVGDGAELLEIVDRLHPDVILLDISMPRVDGIEAARSLRERGCEAAIIFVTVHRVLDIVETALATGAAGYVVKARADRDLIPAIDAVAGGRRFLSPPLRDFEGAESDA